MVCSFGKCQKSREPLGVPTYIVHTGVHTYTEYYHVCINIVPIPDPQRVGTRSRWGSVGPRHSNSTRLNYGVHDTIQRTLFVLRLLPALSLYYRYLLLVLYGVCLRPGYYTEITSLILGYDLNLNCFSWVSLRYKIGTRPNRVITAPGSLRSLRFFCFSQVAQISHCDCITNVSRASILLPVCL